MLSKVDYVVDHKANLNTFERVGVIQTKFSDHVAIKLQLFI